LKQDNHLTSSHVWCVHLQFLPTLLISIPNTVCAQGFYWIPSLAGPTTVAARQSGSGTAWLLPFVDGAPASGWDEALPYLALPVMLIIAQVCVVRGCVCLLPCLTLPVMLILARVCVLFTRMCVYVCAALPGPACDVGHSPMCVNVREDVCAPVCERVCAICFVCIDCLLWLN